MSDDLSGALRDGAILAVVAEKIRRETHQTKEEVFRIVTRDYDRSPERFRAKWIPRLSHEERVEIEVQERSLKARLQPSKEPTTDHVKFDPKRMEQQAEHLKRQTVNGVLKLTVSAEMKSLPPSVRSEVAQLLETLVTNNGVVSVPSWNNPQTWDEKLAYVASWDMAEGLARVLVARKVPEIDAVLWIRNLRYSLPPIDEKEQLFRKHLTEEWGFEYR